MNRVDFLKMISGAFAAIPFLPDLYDDELRPDPEIEFDDSNTVRVNDGWREYIPGRGYVVVRGQIHEGNSNMSLIGLSPGDGVHFRNGKAMPGPSEKYITGQLTDLQINSYVADPSYIEYEVRIPYPDQITTSQLENDLGIAPRGSGTYQGIVRGPRRLDEDSQIYEIMVERRAIDVSSYGGSTRQYL